MKRVLIIFVILILLASTGFGFGYVQLRIDASEVGVLFSRTSGWDPTVHQAGDFSWRWQLLIPKNAQILRFPIEPRRVEVRSRSFLPSADLYREYLEGNPDLGHRITLRVGYRSLPAAPASLAPHGINPEAFEDWLLEQDDQIRVEAIEAVEVAAENGTTSVSDLSQSVHDFLAFSHPELEIISVAVEEIVVPDFALYEAGRVAYGEVQASRRQTLVEAASAVARDEARAVSQVDILRRYGAILTEYPVLLEYVRIAAETGADPLEMGLPEGIPLPE